MIKVNKDDIAITGNIWLVMAELAAAIKSFRIAVSEIDGEEIADTLTRECIKTAFMSDKELEED